MTSRVYIEGDLGRTTSLGLFDADTGRKLDDVAEMQITVTANNQFVDLRRVNSTATERCELVPRPDHPQCGKELTHVSLTREDHPDRTVYEARVEVLEVGPLGELILTPGSWRIRQEVSNLTLATFRDPSALLQHEAEIALTQAVKSAIIDPLLSQGAPAPAPTKSTCAECKGTGEVLLFNGPSPCSRGCTKP